MFGHRIGFSGTPSYLLPRDLGDCMPEPTSDGKIMGTLTSPAIVSAELKREGWSAKKLLDDIARGASQTRPFFSLFAFPLPLSLSLLDVRRSFFAASAESAAAKPKHVGHPIRWMTYTSAGPLWV